MWYGICTCRYVVLVLDIVMGYNYGTDYGILDVGYFVPNSQYPIHIGIYNVVFGIGYLKWGLAYVCSMGYTAFGMKDYNLKIIIFRNLIQKNK